MNESRLEKIVNAVVFLMLVGSVIYIVVRIALTRGGVPEESGRPESEYILMLLQCLLGIFIMFLPGLIERRLKLDIPNLMHILFVLFLFCAIYLGEVRSFYYTFQHWDVLLHAFSSGMLGAIGFSFITLLNRAERVPVNLSPVFVALFAFCFAVMLGVVWEIYEFTFDGLLGLNMQKFAIEDGTLLVGHTALENTMKDLIVDTIGALVISVLGYISMKYRKGWVEKMLIHRIRSKRSSGTGSDAGAKNDSNTKSI